MSQNLEFMIIRSSRSFPLWMLGLTCLLIFPICGCHPLGLRWKGGLNAVDPNAEDDWAPPKVNNYSHPVQFPRKYQPTPAQDQQTNNSDRNNPTSNLNGVVLAAGEAGRNNADPSRKSSSTTPSRNDKSLLQPKAQSQQSNKVATNSNDPLETNSQEVDLEDAMLALPPNMRDLLRRQMDAIAERNQKKQEAEALRLAAAEQQTLQQKIQQQLGIDATNLPDESINSAMIPVHSLNSSMKSANTPLPSVAEAKPIAVTRALSDELAHDPTQTDAVSQRKSAINNASFQQTRNSPTNSQTNLAAIPIETSPNPKLIAAEEPIYANPPAAVPTPQQPPKEKVQSKISDSVVAPADDPLLKTSSAVRTSLSDANDNSVRTASATVPNAPNAQSDVVTANTFQPVAAANPHWNHSVQEAIEKLELQLKDSPASDENIRLNQEVTLRMLYLANRQIDAAMRPIDGLEANERDYFKHELLALYEAANPDAMPVKSRRWSAVMNNQRQATNHLASVSNLEVKSVSFCTDVQGYGVVTKFPNYQFKPDQDLLLYCELDNVSAEQVKEGFETQLQGTYEIYDPNGRRIADQLLPMEKEICKNHRRDYFIVYRIYMPMQIAPGNYQLRLTIEDMKARKFGQSQIDFQIQK